jgi:CheY-like chemotaxis protein
MKQDMLRERLESQGAKVAAAGSLVDAFHLVRSWGPDAVVVDARVLELKGVEVCRILREARGCERLPTIVFDEQRRQAHEEEGEKNWVSRYCSGLESVVNAFEELSSDPS